jgi:hypothetical protein
MSSTNARLASSVVKTLREAEVRSINFQYAGTTINGSSVEFVVTGMRYSVVADAVEKGRITCNLLRSSRSDDLPQGNIAVAQYVPSAGDKEGYSPDQFLFRRESFGEFLGAEKATIVHEATHAIHDVYLAKNCLAIEDEATAWLAQALYMRFTPRPVGGGAMLIGGPLDEALKLADKLIATGFGRVTRPVYAPDLQPLKHAIAVEYGLVGGKAGIQSVYDGVAGVP